MSGSAATRRRPIALAPGGELEPGLLELLAETIRSVFGREVVRAERFTLPPQAYSEKRGQWHSSAILELLAHAKRPEWSRLLGLVEVDLYVPELNFVFGEADGHRGVAVFSTARLHADADGTRLFQQRACVEAIHELGHTFGLRHCSRPDCVMWFSNTLAETDRKGFHPCEEHARALARALEVTD